MMDKTMLRTGTDAATGLDFDARYSVSSMPGVAFWLLGYALEWSEETWELACDETSDHDHTSDCETLYSEPEQMERGDMVRAVMVGDDAVHLIDVADLTMITEDDYCGGCGQIGCPW